MTDIVSERSDDGHDEILAVEHTSLESFRWNIFPASIDLRLKDARIDALNRIYALCVLRRDGCDCARAFKAEIYLSIFGRSHLLMRVREGGP